MNKPSLLCPVDHCIIRTNTNYIIRPLLDSSNVVLLQCRFVLLLTYISSHLFQAAGGYVVSPWIPFEPTGTPYGIPLVVFQRYFFASKDKEIGNGKDMQMRKCQHSISQAQAQHQVNMIYDLLSIWFWPIGGARYLFDWFLGIAYWRQCRSVCTFFFLKKRARETKGQAY